MITWIAVFSMFIEDLPQQMEENFKQYEGEFGKSKPSIVFNFMFVEFATCGISGDHDFEQLNITWNKISSKIFKQSCCSNNSMKWEGTKAQSFFVAVPKASRWSTVVSY